MEIFKMNVSKWIVFSLVALQLAGCVSINSVSLTPIPANRKKEVKAEVSKTVFLGFNFNNDFLDPLVDKLKSQCPEGVVSGILTKDEVIAYVLVFTRKVTATGYCNEK
jgi:dihydroorotate dehydrogenase